MLKTDFDRWNIGKDDDEEDKKSQVLVNTENRNFFLYGDINARNCAELAFAITQINAEDDGCERVAREFEREPIILYINSTGGSVYAMWMLADTIAGSRTPVFTICTGYVMSAAFIIFLSGTKRFMSPHATLMYHQISCWKYGKYQDLVDDMEHTDCLNEMLEDYVVERTNLTKEELLEIRSKKKDTYFPAPLAKRLGIVDEILG